MTTTSWILLAVAIILGALYLMRRSANRRARSR